MYAGGHVESRSARTRQLLGLMGALLLAGCGLRSTAANLYPELVEHEGKKIDRVRFTGTEPFRPDTLQKVVETKPSRCNFLGLPFCVPFTRIGREEHFLNLGRVQKDVETLERFYRLAGYFGTSVTPSVGLVTSTTATPLKLPKSADGTQTRHGQRHRIRVSRAG